jgi:NitT/TauT family transport system ATP-binding protein
MRVGKIELKAVPVGSSGGDQKPKAAPASGFGEISADSHTPVLNLQRPPMMPANVRAGQVIGLVEITGGLGSIIDASRLADEFGADLTTLLPILDAAEMLGLVKADKGDVSLTDFGHKFQKAEKYKVKLLKDALSNIEPFRTALELVSKKKRISVQEVAEDLKSRGITWHHKDEINEFMIQTLLIHWAIYAELLTYNGKTGKFQKL